LWVARLAAALGNFGEQVGEQFFPSLLASSFPSASRENWIPDQENLPAPLPAAHSTRHCRVILSAQAG